MSLLRTISGGPVQKHSSAWAQGTMLRTMYGDQGDHFWSKDKPLYTDGRWWHVAQCCDAIYGPFPKQTMKSPKYVFPKELKGILDDYNEISSARLAREETYWSEMFRYTPTSFDYATWQGRGMFPPEDR